MQTACKAGHESCCCDFPPASAQPSLSRKHSGRSLGQFTTRLNSNSSPASFPSQPHLHFLPCPQPGPEHGHPQLPGCTPAPWAPGVCCITHNKHAALPKAVCIHAGSWPHVHPMRLTGCRSPQRSTLQRLQETLSTGTCSPAIPPNQWPLHFLPCPKPGPEHRHPQQLGRIPGPTGAWGVLHHP
jgi:hypothetical protein